MPEGSPPSNSIPKGSPSWSSIPEGSPRSNSDPIPEGSTSWAKSAEPKWWFRYRRARSSLAGERKGSSRV
eukprot:scaffold3737_cov137-Isochrysis_galbana.AAC.5